MKKLFIFALFTIALSMAVSHASTQSGKDDDIKKLYVDEKQVVILNKVIFLIGLERLYVTDEIKVDEEGLFVDKNNISMIKDYLSDPSQPHFSPEVDLKYWDMEHGFLIQLLPKK